MSNQAQQLVKKCQETQATFLNLSYKQLSQLTLPQGLSIMKTKTGDYCDYATLQEIAVTENNEEKVKDQLRKALTPKIEDWIFETTLNNQNLIKAYLKKRKADTSMPENMIQYITQQRKN